MNREILITSDGGLMDAIKGVGAPPIDVMPGDPILRERVNRLLARDCARRRLLWMLLPAISATGRQLVRGEIDGWRDEEVQAAAWELLELSGWGKRQ